MLDPNDDEDVNNMKLLLHFIFMLKTKQKTLYSSIWYSCIAFCTQASDLIIDYSVPYWLGLSIL